MSQRHSPSKPWLALLLPLACGAATIMLQWSGGLDTFHRVNYDIWLRNFHSSPPRDDRIIFLAMDDKTLEAIETYPIPRRTHAELIRGLKTAGAHSTIFDVIFDYRRGLDTRQQNEELAASMRSLPTLLAIGARPSSRQGPSPREWDTAPLRHMVVGPTLTSDWTDVPEMDIHLLSEALLLEAAQKGGHVAATPDPDGVLRRVPLLIRLRKGGALLPALGLAATMDLLDVPPDDLELRGTTLVLGKKTLDAPILIPVDKAGVMRLNFLPKWHETIDWRSYEGQLGSLRDFPDDFVEVYQNRAVLIGSTYSGSGDTIATPVTTDLPGPLVTYNVMNTILTGHFIRDARAITIFILTLVLPLMVGVFYLLRRTRPVGVSNHRNHCWFRRSFRGSVSRASFVCAHRTSHSLHGAIGDRSGHHLACPRTHACSARRLGLVTLCVTRTAPGASGHRRIAGTTSRPPHRIDAAVRRHCRFHTLHRRAGA